VAERRAEYREALAVAGKTDQWHALAMYQRADDGSAVELMDLNVALLSIQKAKLAYEGGRRETPARGGRARPASQRRHPAKQHTRDLDHGVGLSVVIAIGTIVQAFKH
jgi:hypothetical protein